MNYIQGIPRRQTILFPKAIDDYIPSRRQAGPARRLCLLRGKGEISWNFAYKVDKKLLFTQPGVRRTREQKAF